MYPAACDPSCWYRYDDLGRVSSGRASDAGAWGHAPAAPGACFVAVWSLACCPPPLPCFSPSLLLIRTALTTPLPDPPGDFFPPVFNCPHTVERLGALGDGGKWVCGLERLAEKPDCVIYSFGASHSALR